MRAPLRRKPRPERPDSPARSTRPRVGLLVDALVDVLVDVTTVPAWVNDVLRGIAAESSLDWAGTWAAAPPTSPLHPSAVVRAYEALDQRRYGRPTNALDRLAPIVDLAAIPPGAPPGIPPGATHLDVLVDLRDRPVPGDPSVLSAGISAGEWWWVELDPAGEPPLWEALRSRATTCDVRVVVRSGDHTRLAAASTVGLTPASLTVSRNTAFGRASELVTRQLGDLGAGRATDSAANRAAAPYTTPAPVAITSTRTVVAVAAARAGAAAQRAVARRTREQWIVGVRRAGKREPTDAGGYVPITQPADRQYADPFLATHDGRTFLFLEDFPFDAPHAVISVAELGADATISAPEHVLVRPYHLSYPFVFRAGDSWFMIPETASNRTIELYRATSFPNGWELESVLMEDVAARDTTLLRVDDRLWLFTCIDSPNGGRHDELHLFSSDGLDGPWLPHPRNPVVSDVRCARPAGAVFSHLDELIRPAQDCAERYGGATVFRAIDRLDRLEYREHTVGRLDPTWAAGLHGTHTYNRAAGLEVVDGARMVRAGGTPRRVRPEP